MGIFDQIKNAFSKPEDEPAKQEVTPAPKPTTQPTPTEQPVTEQAPADSADATARTYTVESGDTLWKIAEKMYGNGSEYPKIFDANSELLDSPDHILPGQELTIP